MPTNGEYKRTLKDVKERLAQLPERPIVDAGAGMPGNERFMIADLTQAQLAAMLAMRGDCAWLVEQLEESIALVLQAVPAMTKQAKGKKP